MCFLSDDGQRLMFATLLSPRFSAVETGPHCRVEDCEC